jgi:hypothetical protein
LEVFENCLKGLSISLSLPQYVVVGHDLIHLFGGVFARCSGIRKMVLGLQILHSSFRFKRLLIAAHLCAVAMSIWTIASMSFGSHSSPPIPGLWPTLLWLAAEVDLVFSQQLVARA